MNYKKDLAVSFGGAMKKTQMVQQWYFSGAAFS